MHLSQFQTKRATLQSQLEQLVGQINRVNGAVAVLDELIGEEGERQEREREAAPVLSAQQIVNDALAKVAAIQAALSEPSYSLDGIEPPAPTQLESRP